MFCASKLSPVLIFYGEKVDSQKKNILSINCFNIRMLHAAYTGTTGKLMLAADNGHFLIEEFLLKLN